MPLGRGFKAEAERSIDDIRRQLELNDDDQIDPLRLASHLQIEVRKADELVDLQSLRELESLHPGAFSACTFKPNPERTVIVYNPLHQITRRNSDLAHELAHIILRHELTRLERLGEVSYFVCDAQQEEEAAWLSGCLLLPRKLLLADLRRGSKIPDIARKRRVSEAMVTYRINVTGVTRQLGALTRRRVAKARRT
jgi:Zn-dependent peptidase ImmA (M78 family)